MADSASGTSGPYIPAYGDIVWAKMQKYPYWPGEVHKPPKNEKVPKTKKNCYWIFFYGTENFGWAVEDCIAPFIENKEKYRTVSKLKSFIKAIATAEEICRQKAMGGEGPSRSLDLQANQASETANAKIATSESPEASTSAEPPRKKTKETLVELTTEPFVPPVPRSPAKSRDTQKNTRRQKSIMFNLQEGTKQTNADFVLSFNTPRAPTAEEAEIAAAADEAAEAEPDPRKYTVGVLGLGALGSEITSLLLESNHDVTVWNRTETKMMKFLEQGAKKGESPGQVFKSCDITLACVSTSEALQTITYMRSGLYTTADDKCSLVVFTLMDPDDAMDVSELVSKGVHYLEAPVCRTIGGIVPGQAELDKRSLVVLASGDKSVFEACSSVFRAISPCSVFIGPTCGVASKIALVTNSFIGSTVSAVAEAMALAERTELFPSELLHVLSVSPIGSTFLLHKGKSMMDKEFPARMPLEQLEIAMRSALNMSAKYNHSMPLAAASHELYVSAKAMNYGERDMSAVYLPARF